jgi:pimeloyl-ACP methyl ester carboxylesterase
MAYSAKVRLALLLGVTLAIVPGSTPVHAQGSSVKAKPRPPLKWKACEDARAVQCSTLRVPLDWSRPKGRKVSIALARLPAGDMKRRVGSLLFNCGGSGRPGAQVVKLRPDAFTPRLRERFDIVGFDSRATGESTPVRCGPPSFDPSIPRYPGNEAGYQRLHQFNPRLRGAAGRMTGPYLMNLASPAVVRDIEAIRESLRDGKLNWLGLSYGTMLSALYAGRYPKRIRTLALDGAPNRSPIPAAGVGRGVTGEEIQNNTDAEYLLFTRPNAFGSVS